MKYETLIIEKKEYKKLRSYLENAHYGNDQVFKRAIGSLLNELKTAKIVPEEEMPDDVVRFYSNVTIQTPFVNGITYQIVTPEESNLKENKISILSPMALALFGYAENDSIEWQFPNGINTLMIRKVAIETEKTTH